MATLVLPFTGTSERPDVPSFQVNDNVAGVALDGVSTGFNPLPGDAFPVVFSIGVRGTSQAVNSPIPQQGPVPQQLESIGVQGNTTSGDGVQGNSTNGAGVRGNSQNNDGVAGAGVTGVSGESRSSGGTGVFGHNNTVTGSGVIGRNESGTGVLGQGGRNGVVGTTASNTDAGVNGGNSGSGFGVFGGSVGGAGVEGHSVSGSGVVGFTQSGIGVVGRGGRLAGRFEGDVEVTGDIRLVGAGQDCAEDFDVAGSEKIEPGTVMVIDPLGELRKSEKAYDKSVAGVVSGAGDFKPAILLGTQQPGTNRTPIALLGKVYCKVDAQYSPVEVGDLLTTSPTPGYAMKAADPIKAFGSVIGKALRPLATGQQLVPILIALQ